MNRAFKFIAIQIHAFSSALWTCKTEFFTGNVQLYSTKCITTCSCKFGKLISHMEKEGMEKSSMILKSRRIDIVENNILDRHQFAPKF